MHLIVVAHGSKSLGDYHNKEKDPKVIEICDKLSHYRDNCTDCGSIALTKDGKNYADQKSQIKRTIAWSKQSVRIENIPLGTNEATRLKMERRNNKKVLMAELPTINTRESHMSMTITVCRKLF